MGADIHMYAEYKPRGYGQWLTFGGRINPGRSYRLFARLANVRGGGAMFPVRGMPADAAYEALWDDRFYISTEPSESYVAPEVAEQWVHDGVSSYAPKADGTPGWVTNPDWHSHSWLTASELAEVYESFTDEDPIPVEYYALLAALRELETRADAEARVVFWFDN